MTDESAFLEFKADPAPERLERLLTSVQDRVYNICFQILRRAEDAEDACQEVLLEVTRGLGRIDAPRAFKVWLYRVAVHTSLDRKEARDRRARLAPQPKGPAMNDAEREELMRAIRTLDDRTRCLVLEHYFDKATLEEIGAREGISAPAVHKRLERARETLRRALLGAGITVAAAGVAEALESITPVAAPAGIAGKALLAGGAIMGTKSAVSGGTIVAALLLVGAASTGGYFVGASRAEKAREVTTPAKPAPEVAKSATPPAEKTETVARGEGPAAPEKADGTTTLEATFGEMRTTGRSLTVDPETVRYGRPARAAFEELTKAETWDDFYRKAKGEKNLGQVDFENLVFDRVCRELNLDANTRQALRAILDAERIDATRAIVDAAGGPASFAVKLNEPGWNWQAVKPEWNRIRDAIRKARDEDYLKHLAYDQLTFFNQHLRNSELSFEASYGGEGTYYLVTGVGRKPDEAAEKRVEEVEKR